MEPVSLSTGKRKPSTDDSDDTGSSMPVSRSRKRIPSDQWEKMRPIIARLYQEEKRSLKEVMEILERDHHFTATVKMFKSRIWKWGLDKKLKSDEVLAILIIKRQREMLDKPSEFTIRGQPVDLDNINRYIKRNPSLVARFEAGQKPSIQTSMEVQCRTPSPSPCRSLPPSPESYRIEEVMGLFRNYIDGSFDSGKWECEYNVDYKSLLPGDRSDELFERVITSFALVNRCLMRGDSNIPYGAILNPAFESLKEIIETESPVFVVRTVCLLWYLDRHHKNDLLRLVMSYLADLVPIVLGPHHIMARIWRTLGSAHISDYYELSLRLYALLVPLLEKRIGPANYLTSILYSDHIDCLFNKTDSSQSLAVASQYRRRAESTNKQHPWLTELAITQTALLCASKEAEGLIGDAIECLQTLKSYGMTEEQSAVVNIQLGNYSFQLGDIAQATHSYREATRLAVLFDGDSRLLLTCLANLESALSKQGKPADASRVNQYRMKRICEFAKESSDFANSHANPGENYASDIITVGQTRGFYDDDEDKDLLDWLFNDDPLEDLLRAVPRVNTPMGWLDMPVTIGDWTESIADSSAETMTSQYPSLSPSIEGWDASSRQPSEWNGSCYG